MKKLLNFQIVYTRDAFLKGFPKANNNNNNNLMKTLNFGMILLITFENQIS